MESRYLISDYQRNVLIKIDKFFTQKRLHAKEKDCKAQGSDTNRTCKKERKV